MKYTQPELPYPEDSLAPAISAQTIRYHYGKHEKAYIDNLNRLIKGTKFEDMDLEDIITESEGPLFNNASQAWNHIFYFFGLHPEGGGEPTGELRLAIERDFGSFENLKAAMIDAGMSIFGSGWVWLSRDNKGKLLLTHGANAQNPMTEGLTPVMTIDVWEHAYYLDYQNNRKGALEAIWSIVDWAVIEARYEE